MPNTFYGVTLGLSKVLPHLLVHHVSFAFHVDREAFVNIGFTSFHFVPRPWNKVERGETDIDKGFTINMESKRHMMYQQMRQHFRKAECHSIKGIRHIKE